MKRGNGYLVTWHRFVRNLQHIRRSIVVLDDDPTGTQTVHGIPVVTQWTEEVLEKELLASPLFFILINSRSLQAKEADALGKQIGKRLAFITKKHHKNLLVISRSDSTLRGHYPNEVDALADGLGWHRAKHVLIPAFFEGGRYTFDDIHYVKEGDDFIPAAETSFAEDNTFGYSSSNLKDWIVEKTGCKIKREKITAVSIQALRTEPAEALRSILEDTHTTHIMVNATCNVDLQVLALACLQTNKKYIFRTGASFVNAISGIEAREFLTKTEILPNDRHCGALIVVGSYVPKTTEQLNFLKANSKAAFLEMDVSHVLDSASFQEQLKILIEKIDQLIASNKNTVLYTSRTIIKGATKSDSLEIVNRVSSGLIFIIEQLKSSPSYILAKGGITSSDVATKGLSVQRARVLGQVLKGVPVWKLGPESKYPNMPYIVFPGNVGNESALYNVIKLLK